MKVKRICSVLCSLIIVVVLFGSLANASPKFTVRVGHADAPGTKKDRASDLFKELVEKYTDGQVQVTVYPSNQLGDLTTQVEGCQVGTHDIVITMDTVVPLVPQIGVLDLPYLFKDRDRVERVLKGPIGQELLDLLPDTGLIGLAWWENGYRHITNNRRPIRVPDDLKGIKIRTPQSPARMRMFEIYGANPAPLSFAELFSALQQGVFDGQENPLMNVSGSKFYEVQKYLSLSGHVYNPQVLLMSKMLWDEMPRNFQQAIKQAAEEVGDHMRRTGEEEDKNDLAYLTGKMEINEVDFEAFQEASKPLYEEFPYQELLQRILETVK